MSVVFAVGEGGGATCPGRGWGRGGSSVLGPDWGTTCLLPPSIRKDMRPETRDNPSLQEKDLGREARGYPSPLLPVNKLKTLPSHRTTYTSGNYSEGLLNVSFCTH